MECLRPILASTPDRNGRYGGATRPLSFGFEPAAWSQVGTEDRVEKQGASDVGETRARKAILDAITLQPRYLYELSGEASAGKTQLCLQLIARAVLSGPEDGRSMSSFETLNRAVYLFTEGGTVKMDRLRQIVLSRLGDENMTDAVMQHVHVEHAANVDDVIAKLLVLEDVLRVGSGGHVGQGDAKSPVTLFVLDSIAHVFRFREDDAYEASVTRYDTSRTHAFFRIASILKRYADEYNVVVLVTNQVVDAVDAGENGEGGDAIQEGKDAGRRGPGVGDVDGVQDRPGCAGLKLETSGRLVYPALGLAWSSCVNTRLFVTKETATCDETQGKRPVIVEGGLGGKQLRGLQVVFSPELKQVKTHFVIGTEGCIGVDVGSACLGFGGE